MRVIVEIAAAKPREPSAKPPCPAACGFSRVPAWRPLPVSGFSATFQKRRSRFGHRSIRFSGGRPVESLDREPGRLGVLLNMDRAMRPLFRATGEWPSVSGIPGTWRFRRSGRLAAFRRGRWRNSLFPQELAMVGRYVARLGRDAVAPREPHAECSGLCRRGVPVRKDAVRQGEAATDVLFGPERGERAAPYARSLPCPRRQPFTRPISRRRSVR